MALSVPNGEDEHHVVLLLPDGKGLDAGGTRSRGVNPAVLSAVQIQTSVLQRAPIVQKVMMPGTTGFETQYGHGVIDALSITHETDIA